MKFYGLVLGVLVVWRLTHLVVAEDGPWDLVLRLRRLAGTGFWAKLLDCFYCSSLWVAAPLAVLIGQDWLERSLLWPALSAGAILLQRITHPEESAPPALYYEEEPHDGMLRRSPETDDGGATSRDPETETEDGSRNSHRNSHPDTIRLELHPDETEPAAARSWRAFALRR